MTTDPVHDAAVHYDAVLGYAERMAEAEGKLAAKFVSTALTGMAYKEADFFELTDYATKKPRKAYIYEAMLDTFDADEEVAATVMKALMNCAKDGDLEAINAITLMAVTFAKQHATLEDV